MSKLFFDVIGREDLFHHAVNVEECRVMACVAVLSLRHNLSFYEILVIVEVAIIRRYAEVSAHILGAEPLLSGHQRFIELFAVAGAYDVCPRVTEQLLYRFCKVADGAGVSLLNEQVAGVGVVEGEADQFDRLVEIHHEPCHVGVGDRDGGPGFDLVDEQRYDAAPAAHDVAVAGTADDSPTALGRNTGVGENNMFHHRFGDPHRVDRVRRLIGGQADDALDARFDCSVQDVVGPHHVRAHGFHREELARRHLLQRRGVEYVIDARHRVAHGIDVAYISYVEFDLPRVLRIFRLKLVTHIVLLLLVAGEDADLGDIGRKKMF